MSLAPLLFVGHGSPMNALGGNPYMDAWRAIGARLPALSGILCVSAHWETRGTRVSASAKPETIHDFYGFPKELYAIDYPAPGAPALADKVRALLGPDCAIDLDRGLDHGAWCPLVGFSPEASIPVAQLSLSRSLSPEGHLALAAKLSPLRDEGVLILGSGDAVHNLRIMRDGAPYAWAERIDALIEGIIRKVPMMEADESNRLRSRLAKYLELDPEARLAVPSEEHYLPLLYVSTLVRRGESVETFTRAIEYGSVSMTGYAFGLGD